MKQIVLKPDLDQFLMVTSQLFKCRIQLIGTIYKYFSFSIFVL
jgi:hypothetical protein